MAIELHLLAGGLSKKVAVDGKGYARIDGGTDGIWRGLVYGGPRLEFPDSDAAHAWLEAMVYECAVRTCLSVVVP